MLLRSPRWPPRPLPAKSALHSHLLLLPGKPSQSTLNFRAASFPRLGSSCSPCLDPPHLPPSPLGLSFGGGSPGRLILRSRWSFSAAAHLKPASIPPPGCTLPGHWSHPELRPARHAFLNTEHPICSIFVEGRKKGREEEKEEARMD